jgi:ABC-2 type transport system permease protein
MFFISKLIRYSLFLTFLYFITTGVTQLGDYTGLQMLTFYIVFTLIDTTSQMLYREVYRFRPLVISGGFDGVLTKPFPPLLRVLVGGPDFIDLGILLVLMAIFVVLIFSLSPSLVNILLFVVLFICAQILATAFHIFVLGIGIMTFSVDHLVMIYRDFTSLMRIPVDFFSDSLRFLFTFILPLGVMFTFPAKVLMGLLDPSYVLLSVGLSIVSLYLSIKFWGVSLKYYQSASS